MYIYIYICIYLYISYWPFPIGYFLLDHCAAQKLHKELRRQVTLLQEDGDATQAGQPYRVSQFGHHDSNRNSKIIHRAI